MTVKASVFSDQPGLGEERETVYDLEASGKAAELELERTPTDLEAPASTINQPIGVTKIESLYLVYGKGWKLFALWASIGLIAYVWSLAAITTGIYGAFATSYFGKHTLVGTIAVINNIIAAVCLPFLAKIADVVSRPAALTVATVLFTVGYVCVASSQNIQAVVAGQALYTAGRLGIYQMMHTLISDMTPLQSRGLLLGVYSLPFVMNGFLAGLITANIRALSSAGGDGWRWGFGMFCIIIPVALCPGIAVMLWGHRKAKRLGALSIADSNYARKRVVEGDDAVPYKTRWEAFVWWANACDIVGLLLMGFAFALLLAPPTLAELAEGGNKNPSLIGMYVCGGVIFFLWIWWEVKYATSPIFARRLWNRTFLTCVVVDALHFFSTDLTDAYANSWVYILKPQWSERNYTFFSATHQTGLCFFAALTGLAMRFTHNFRWLQIGGIAVRCIGEGLHFWTANGNQSDALFIMARIVISAGAGVVVTTTAVAGPASAPHADMAASLTLLHMVAQLGGSIANTISSTIWNSQVPKNLAKYLPDTDEDTRKKIFGNIRLARRTQPHDQVIIAYTLAMRPMLAAAIGTTLLAFFVSLTTKDMHLGRNHNNAEPDKIVRMRGKDEVTDEAIGEKVREAEDKARADLDMKGR